MAHSSLRLQRLLGPPLRLPRLAVRYSSSKIKQPYPYAVENVTPIDPRPSWAFPLSKIANYMVIPGTVLYAVFFADFGERDHVFMPARRWLESQRAAFFSLSEAEREIAGIVDEAAEKGTAGDR